MTPEEKTLTKQIIGISAVAGMRATFAPAIISHYYSRQNNAAIKNSNLAFMASPVTALVTKGLAVLEVIGDKLPSTPNRIAFPQILGRIGSGAFAGAVLCKAQNKSIFKGILLGGASALASSFAAFYLRGYIDTLPHVKDIETGAAEDVAALVTGVMLMR